MKPPQILRGGPFGGLRLPKYTIVLSDAMLLRWGVELGYLPRACIEAELVVIELGRVQTKNDMAPAVLAEILLARYSAGVQTVLLCHTNPRYEWRSSKSEELEDWLVRIGTSVQDWRGVGHIRHTQLDYIHHQQIDDGSDIGPETEQGDYR